MATTQADTPFVGVQPIFTSSDYSDLVVLCDKDKYWLHREIICPRSRFFAKAYDEFSTVSPLATITLHEDDPRAINRMLIYLYSNDYPDGNIPLDQRPLTVSGSSIPLHLASPGAPANEPAKSRPAHENLINNVLVHAIASKYDVPRLKSLARTRFQSLLKTSPHTKIASIINTILDITQAIDYELRDIIIQVCALHFDQLAPDATFVAAIKRDADLSFSIFIATRQLEKQAFDKVLIDKATAEVEIRTSQLALRKANERERKAIDEKKSAIDSQFMAIQMKDSLNDQIERMNSQKDADTKATERLTKEAKDRLTKDRDALIRMKNDAISQLNREKDVAVSERDKADEREALALRQKNSALAQRKRAEQERDDALKLNETFISKLDTYLRKTWDWDDCRHCGLDFNYHIERFGGDGDLKLQLRCWKCDTRHDLGAGRG